MITTLGMYHGFAVVEQDSEGFTTLHVIADEGSGQWDVFPLIGCATFEQARVAIDQWVAFDTAMNEPEEYVPFDEDLAAELWNGIK